MSTKKRSVKPKGTVNGREATHKTKRARGKPALKAETRAKSANTRRARPQVRGKKTTTPAHRRTANSGRAPAFAYDVCLSFAGEDRTYVQRVAKALTAQGTRVFYDQYEQTTLWGKDLYTHLDDVYRNKARFCVMFISEAYRRKLWTNHERQSAQARAFRSNQEYILPARFDDTEIPGIRETIGYISLQNRTPAAFAKLILAKIGEASGVTSPASISTRVPTKGARTQQMRASPTGLRTKVSSSGAWVLLGDTFFQSRAVNDCTDGTIKITLAVNSPSQEAALRAINAGPYQRRTIAYAHGNDAAYAEIQSVVMGSVGGKHTCTVMLRPDRRHDTTMEVTVNGITPDQSAEKRARLILIGEPLTTGDYRSDDFLLGLFGRGIVEEKMLDAVLPKLWPTYNWTFAKCLCP